MRRTLIARPGRGIVASKIISSTSGQYTEDNKGLIQLLKDRGIDTTFHRYELYAQTYERYEEGSKYKLKFKCPGDYLAYFSMALHETPNYDNMEFYCGGIEEIAEFLDEYPTLNDIRSCAEEYWWGDGSDYIIYLKNIDTGDKLYFAEDDELYFAEDDDWD